MSPFSNFFPMGDGVYDVTKAQCPWAVRHPYDTMPHGSYDIVSTHGAWIVRLSLAYGFPMRHRLYNFYGPWGMGRTTCTAHEPWIVRHPAGL